MHGLPKSVRTLWRQIAVGRAVLLGVVVGVLTAGTRAETDAGALWFLLPIVVTLLVGALGWWWATAKWRSWGFDLTNRWITASWGVVQRHTVTLPRNRVQTVTTGNGPIDRFLSLTSITIHTAGAGSPNLAIPHLEDATVAWLRTELGQGVVSA